MQVAPTLPRVKEAAGSPERRQQQRVFPAQSLPRKEGARRIRTRIVAVTFLLAVVSLLGAIAIFRNLGIYISVIAIGLALALQKYIGCYFGFFLLSFSKIFDIGDRIRIGAIKGDVRRIGLFHFVLEEVGEDEKLGGELTGRLLYIPNLIVLDQPVLNYSKDYSVKERLLESDYIFDEVRIPLTVQSDIEKAGALLERILRVQEQEYIEQAKKNFQDGYPRFVTEAEGGPRILIYIEPQRIWLKGKFVAPVRMRNHLKTDILMEFIRQIRDGTGIQIA